MYADRPISEVVISSSNVFLCRHGLKMTRIDADSISAEVVKMDPVLYFFNLTDVDSSVRHHCALLAINTPADPSIAILSHAASKVPTIFHTD